MPPVWSSNFVSAETENIHNRGQIDEDVRFYDLDKLRVHERKKRVQNPPLTGRVSQKRERKVRCVSIFS